MSAPSTTAWLNVSRFPGLATEWSVRLYAPTDRELFAWVRFGVWLAEAFPLSVEAVHVGRSSIQSGRRRNVARLFVRVRR